jgi:hypothetical protein
MRKTIFRTTTEMLALIVLSCIAVYVIHQNGWVTGAASGLWSLPQQPPVSQDQEKIEAFKKRIDAIVDGTLGKNESDCRQVLESVAITVDHACRTAAANVDNSVAQLTSWSGVVMLSSLMVRDTLSDANDADARINRIIQETLLDPLVRDVASVEMQLQRLDEHLKVNRTQMLVEMADVTRQLEISDKAMLDQALREFNAQVYIQYVKVKEIAQRSANAALGLMLTGTFARQTLRSMNTVLASVTSRFLHTQMVSAGLVVSDGPLPFGDAVAVVIEGVGASWCAYELFKVRPELREELEEGLHQGLSELRQNLKDRVQQHIAALASLYAESEKATAQTLKRELD